MRQEEIEQLRSWWFEPIPGYRTMKKEEKRSFKKFKPFQVRWKEPLGRLECPYLYRWSFIFFNYSIRIHHWLRSDVKTNFHDHPYNFISIVLRGSYINVTPNNRIKVRAGNIWYSNASQKHYLDVPKGGAWTLLFCGKPYKKWGFYVEDKFGNEKRISPRTYFNKYGHPACNVQ